ncbi:MAG: T9SS type A sorting domain-containing protein [Ignavibacteriae bacterium]|nr:T9SS type A sorting domain-containing protein [Ignavibacteriota bacterium]
MMRTILLGLDINTHNPNGFSNKQTGASPPADSSNWANFHPPYKATYPWAPGMTNPAVNQAFIDYWHGRMKPRAYSASGYTGAFFHYMSFGPYVFRRGEHVKFAIAQVVGYGAGLASDTVWRDAGGRNAGYGANNGCWFSPTPNWTKTVTYPNLSAISGITTMGSDYLQSHQLPWYVTQRISNADTTPVSSLRDAADRAIQTYTGRSYTKFDGVQFKPESTAAACANRTSYIPVPAPQLFVRDGVDGLNRLTWGAQVEGFTSLPNVQGAIADGRIRSGLSHYIVLKSLQALGAWMRVDSVGKRDPRYFNIDPAYPNQYIIRDAGSVVGETYWYCVISVDSLGARSGMTNMQYHNTFVADVEPTDQTPERFELKQNYPNPFNPETNISFDLPKSSFVTLKVFDLIGREVATIVNEVKQPGRYSVQFDGMNFASGVYVYRLHAGEFVATKKLILFR